MEKGDLNFRAIIFHNTGEQVLDVITLVVLSEVGLEGAPPCTFPDPAMTGIKQRNRVKKLLQNAFSLAFYFTKICIFFSFIIIHFYLFWLYVVPRGDNMGGSVVLVVHQFKFFESYRVSNDLIYLLVCNFCIFEDIEVHIKVDKTNLHDAVMGKHIVPLVLDELVSNTVGRDAGRP